MAWVALEQRSPKTFLTAAGLFVLLAVADGFSAVTGTESAVSPATIFVFLLVVFVGLLGLYPRLADRGSTLALGGVALLAVTAIIICSTIGLSVLPIGLTVGKPTIVAIIMSVVGGATLTLATFGIANLRTGAHPRPIGSFLLLMAASLLFVFVSMMLFSNPGPALVSFGASGLSAISLGGVGCVLRTEGVTANSAESTGDATAD